MRGNTVGSCLAGSCRVSLMARCLAIRTSSMASSPAASRGHAIDAQAALGAGSHPGDRVREAPPRPLASRRNPAGRPILASAPRRPMWSTMGQALKQAPQVLHKAASSGPASARKSSVVLARAACSGSLSVSCASALVGQPFSSCHADWRIPRGPTLSGQASRPARRWRLPGTTDHAAQGHDHVVMARSPVGPHSSVCGLRGLYLPSRSGR